MSAIVVSGGHVLGSGGAVFATGSGGGGGTQINYVLAPTTTTATVYLTVVGTYSLYRNGTLIASSQSSSTYNDTGLSANTTYTYSLTSGGGGFTVTTPVFDYTSFAGTGGTINVGGNGSVQGNQIRFLGGGHVTAYAWYKTQVPPSVFTTTFQFTSPTATVGAGVGTLLFGIQNVVAPPGLASNYGVNLTGDANGAGWIGAQDQNVPWGGVGVKFDAEGAVGGAAVYPATAPAASTGLYCNGYPAVQAGGSIGINPAVDLSPFGFNFFNGSTYNVTIVYDGSLLTTLIQDVSSGAQARFAWPLNLPATTNALQNWIGFTAGSPASSNQYWYVNSWTYTEAYAPRLATPTFSPDPTVEQTGTQTVTISYPAGSSCYYTINGALPTSASTLYTGSITVTANEVIQAVAIQSGFTDSLVGTASYRISTANTINFPSGFASGGLVTAGYAYLSGSQYRVSDNTLNTAGAVWFPAPVNISTFNTTFDLQWGGNGQGMCFVLQNGSPAFTGLTGVQFTGTSGQISFTQPNVPVQVGMYVTINGTTGGSWISGYTNGTIYEISVTNGTTTATLTAAALFGNTGAALTTVVGTPSGLTFAYNGLGGSGGLGAVGAVGNGHGYGGVNAYNYPSQPNGYAFGLLGSIGLDFNQYSTNGSDPTNGVGLYLNGASPYGSQIATGLNFSSGSVFTCALTYDGTNLSMNINSGAFTHSWSVNIPYIVGATTAYAGFTGGSGGGVATVAGPVSWTGF